MRGMAARLRNSVNYESLLGVFVACTLYSGALQLVLFISLHFPPILGKSFIAIAILLAAPVGARVIYKLELDSGAFTAVWIWAAYVAWSTLAVSWTTSVGVVGPKLALFFAINPTFLLLGLLVGYSESALNSLIFAIKVIALLAGVAALTFAELGTAALTSHLSKDTVIVFASGYQPITMAVGVGGALFFVSMLTSRASPIATTIQILGWAFLGIGTLAGGGRSAAIGAGVAEMAILVLLFVRLSSRGESRQARKLLIWSVITVGFGIVLIYLGFQLQLRTLTRLMSFTDTFTDTTGRTWLFNKALLMASAHPIFGAGFGSFHSTALNIESLGIYPHNIFLEILAETGLIGLILYTSFVGTTIYLTLVRAQRLMLEHAAVWSAFMVTAIVANMVSGTITDRFMIFSLGMGLGLVSRMRTTDNEPVDLHFGDRLET